MYNQAILEDIKKLENVILYNIPSNIDVSDSFKLIGIENYKAPQMDYVYFIRKTSYEVRRFGSKGQNEHRDGIASTLKKFYSSEDIDKHSLIDYNDLLLKIENKKSKIHYTDLKYPFIIRNVPSAEAREIILKKLGRELKLYDIDYNHDLYFNTYGTLWGLSKNKGPYDFSQIYNIDEVDWEENGKTMIEQETKENFKVGDKVQWLGTDYLKRNIDYEIEEIIVYSSGSKWLRFINASGVWSVENFKKVDTLNIDNVSIDTIMNNSKLVEEYKFFVKHTKIKKL